MTIGEFLKNLGLSDRQVEIYLDVSSFSQSSVVEIAKRTEIPRSTIYLELDRLIKKGLVTVQKIGASKKYSVTRFENFKLKLEEEKDRVDNLLGSVDSVVKKLNDLSGVQTSVEKVLIYKGQAGIKQQIWNILSCKSGLVVGFSPGTMEDVTDRKFSEKFRREFKRRGLNNKVILSKPKVLNWSEVPDFLDKYVEAKTLESTKIRFQHEILIYDDTISIISKKTDKDQYGIEITDKLLVESYRQIFEFLWEHVAYWPEKIENTK